MRLQTVIAEDEPLARELIETLLRREPDVDVVASCADGREALGVLRRQPADLIFLDVKMPGLDGFGLLEELGREAAPRVVFVTAFKEHAVRAFDCRAVDYLLKPFAYDRVREAVARARSACLPRPSAPVLSDPSVSGFDWDRLVVREAGRLTFVRPEEVHWVEAEGNYVRLHTTQERHLLRQPLHEVETRLEPRGFLRLSRSVLVNLDRVKELRPGFHGDAVVVLRDGTRLPLTRTCRDKFDRLIASRE